MKTPFDACREALACYEGVAKPTRRDEAGRLDDERSGLIAVAVLTAMRLDAESTERSGDEPTPPKLWLDAWEHLLDTAPESRRSGA